MVAWTEWLRGWRVIADGVPEGEFEDIVMTSEGTDHVVLRISQYDQDIDGDRRVVRTTSRAFDDQVALFTRRTRDLGFVRVITVRGRPRYVLEPGAGALEWAATVEGVTMRELVESVREGKLGRRVSRLFRQRERQTTARIQALREQLEDAEDEVERLRLDIRTMDRNIQRERET
ncbi:hypothetical protein RLEG3_04020 (plasmid) [Rhizobium leguminosarum bv. trifolii WSM1689]|uniref:hypothetical protein n=1 Tax=Rhizobium TaxID=379 RepID=UPI0003E09869|nr:hypothetical protein [Rhizobium leguminosarum]AHF88272.1 hypothetical protein RLEG3_04020 [Rhizobium leguminosarum bv. trifolii WSM1689]